LLERSPCLYWGSRLPAKQGGSGYSVRGIVALTRRGAPSLFLGFDLRVELLAHVQRLGQSVDRPQLD